MEKKRVNRFETYWYIDEFFDARYIKELNATNDCLRFKVGNYFHTKEEAEAMAAKLRAVLNGADAIQWPSSKEITTKAIDIGNKFSNDVEISSQYACCAKKIAYWLKTKIVK